MTWRKSSYSQVNGHCVEVSGGIAVRDTKQAHLGQERTVLAFGKKAWIQFISHLKETA